MYFCVEHCVEHLRLNPWNMHYTAIRANRCYVITSHMSAAFVPRLVRPIM